MLDQIGPLIVLMNLVLFPHLGSPALFQAQYPIQLHKQIRVSTTQAVQALDKEQSHELSQDA